MSIPVPISARQQNPVIFPPSLKGTGEGHYAWDRIPDTTLSGVGEHAKRDDERYG